MRAIYILFILLIIILNGCATVEVAKEVTKATNSVKRTIQKITSDQDDVEKTENYINEDDGEKTENYIKEDDVEKTENYIKEKEEIVVAKKKEEVVINKQKETATINIRGKTLNQLTQDFGKPDLIRDDGNTKSVRFDASNCRLFIYFDLEVKKPKVEYYEIRNTNDVIQNNNQITGSNNKIISNKVEYNNSTITYKNSNGNTINIENDIDNVKSIELTLKFNQGNQDLLLQGKVTPYNLRLGRAMSYHE